MTIQFEVDRELVGVRLDVALAGQHPELSRAQARRLIQRGHVRVNGEVAKRAYRLRDGERVECELPEPEPDHVAPEDIPLDIVFEDEHVIVINKPPGMVVHPAPGNRSGTLVHALLHHCEGLSGIGGVKRPGIVHRLDKGTSGVMVAAKTNVAHQSLAAQFKAHSVAREYLALVRGTPRAEEGTIDKPIGRHPQDRKRYTTRVSGGREAVTEWRVEERLGETTLLRVRPRTGRTHQIRVHLAAVGLPIAGDPVYGGGKGSAAKLGLDRQALHAGVLGFEHPAREELVRFETPLAPDMQHAVDTLRT